jgi:hypothetical protein
MNRSDTETKSASHWAVASTEHTRSSGAFLIVARWAWTVAALLLAGNFVFSIPPYYAALRTVCTVSLAVVDQCATWQLVPDNMSTLARLHISLDAYAAYTVSITVVTSLLFWAVGIFIFWRKSREWLGLSVSLVYFALVFGAQHVLVGLIGKNDGIVVVSATLIVAVLFEPLRQRMQRLIDRRFYRPSMTLPRLWPRSAPPCARKWSWANCTSTCLPWCRRRCSPPIARCGCVHLYMMETSGLLGEPPLLVPLRKAEEVQGFLCNFPPLSCRESARRFP